MLIILGLMAGLSLPAPDAPPDTMMPVQAVQAQPADLADQMWQVLDLADLMPVLQQEATDEARRMDADGLVGGAGRPWADVVNDIHDPVRLEGLFRNGVAEAADRVDHDLIVRALDFQQSDLGQRVVALEISARRAMLEAGVEDDARQAFRRAEDQPRARLIRRMIADADLVSPNVAGGLNASIAFSRGFAQGKGFDMAPTDPQMLADAWAQRDQIEVEATAWLEGFLMLAYAPMTDDEVARYGAHVASDEGQALSQLLFAGFDRAFGRTSFDMGLAAAQRLQGRQL